MFFIKKENYGYFFWFFVEIIIKLNMKINYVMNWNKLDWKLIKKLISFEVFLRKYMNGKIGKKKRKESGKFVWYFIFLKFIVLLGLNFIFMKMFFLIY